MMIRNPAKSAVTCSALALCATLLLSGQASAAVTFNSAELLASAAAEADPIGTGSSLVLAPGGDEFLSTTTFPAGPLAVASYAQSNAIAFARFPVIQAEANDLETTQLSLVSAAAGTAGFFGDTTANVNVAGADAFSGNNPEFLVYNFTVDQESAVKVGYDVSNNSAFAAFFPGYSIYVYDASNTYLDDESLQNTSGSVTSTALLPGSYTLEIDNSGGNDLAQSVAGLQGGLSVGDFGFTISPVPEPATWGSMLVGFGALGGLMRRSRRAKAAAAI